MLKAVVFVSSLTYSSATSKTSEAEVHNKLKKRLQVKSLEQSFANAMSITTPSSVQTSAAVVGIWGTKSTFASATCSGSFTSTEGYRMGVCVVDERDANNPEGSSPVYSKWSCTQDGDTIALTQQIFSSMSVCSSGGASSSTRTTSIPSTCGGGVKYECSTATTPYDAASAAQLLSFSSQASCTSLSEPNSYKLFGVGCDDHELTTDCGFKLYSNADCTGTLIFAQTFDGLLATDGGQCAMSTDNDDVKVGDDDDDHVPKYDNIYEHYKYDCTSEDDSFCFHVDTKIDYKGVVYSYEDLKAGKEPECSVPHTPSSRGVIITTSCGKTVRVTDTHLLATTRGFQLAYSLKAGDVLFGDYEKQQCTVQAVEKEKTVQQYFGLNCMHSEVLASGLRTSTFGDFHTLPSWYMTYVGGLLGPDRASSLGEYVAEWFYTK